MTKLLWKSLLAGPAAIGAALAVSGAAVAAEAQPIEESTSVDALEQVSFDQEPVQLSQVTSVSQFSDVQPTDWAFQALQNLVDRYNCIEGYPNGTYRGSQALTRYEFAAGLNSCLDVIAQLIQTDAVTAEEFAAVQALQEEFRNELDTLRGRVDALEADVDELEANQFSTTTKLRGQVDAHLGIPFDSFDSPAVEDSTSFTSRARLNFDTSFTGEDRLRIRFQTGFSGSQLAGFNGYANGGGDSGNFEVNDFYYSFPVGERLDVIFAANSIATDSFVTSTIVPWDGPSIGDAGGPLFYDAGADGGAGAGFSFALTDRIVLDAGYSFDPDGGADPDIGIFQASSQSYIGQLSYIGDVLQAGVAYVHGDGSDAFTGGLPGGVDTFGGLLNFNFGRFSVGGWGAYSDFEGDDDFSWMAGVTIADLVLEGTTLGVFGGELPQISYGGIAPADNPFYVEGYYEIPVNEFLTITPAVIYGDAETGGDDDGFWGVLRTTFRF
ncbi:S-layer protein [filamentous cyanobacterium CCP5]|nr:S-layer protein [filamentous cyanobacterium CCP5]